MLETLQTSTFKCSFFCGNLFQKTVPFSLIVKNVAFVLKGQITDVYFWKISSSNSYLSSLERSAHLENLFFCKRKLYLSSLNSVSQQETLWVAQVHSPSPYKILKDSTT